jgi:hypothetical protein
MKYLKHLRSALSVALLSTAALAQPDAKAEPHSHSQKAAKQESEAQKAFAKLKTIAGTWQGKVTTDPPNMFPQDPDPAKNVMNVTMRVTSLGNAIYHNMTSLARPDDPITMLYVDGDQLLLTHYCDAGNRPRMLGKVSADGRSVEFDFLDMTGPTKYGNMQRAKFTFIDDNHHQQTWTYKLPGDKSVVATFDLKRTKSAEVAAR